MCKEYVGGANFGEGRATGVLTLLASMVHETGFHILYNCLFIDVAWTSSGKTSSNVAI
jgi:hypothetical protein